MQKATPSDTRIPARRMPLIDGLKGIACLLIVWHHLAFYGPMSDAARPLAPGLIDWLYEYARMAVQIFLVIGGYLAAASLAPDGQGKPVRIGPLLLKRYQRLAVPCVAALTLAIVSSEVARRLMTHDSIAASPTFGQLVAHLLLLQHLLDFEALSAGIWYVAIDFQLYALAIVLFSSGAWLEGRTSAERRRLWTPALVVVTTLASLFAFNLDERFDDTALYFAGAYGLGILSCWASRSGRPATWILAIAVLGAAALMFEFRDRIAVALATAVLLAWGQAPARASAWTLPGWLSWTGLRSYSIFLVHFPALLAVNAVVSKLWPGDAVAGALGMSAAFVLSIGIAAPFYRIIEARPATPFPEFRFHAAFTLTGLAAMVLGSVSAS